MDEQFTKELEEIIQDRIKYDGESILPDIKGYSAGRRVKKLLKSFRNIMPALPSIFHTEEVLLYATRGTIISNAEQILGGALAANLSNQTFILATSWRLILINISGNGKQKLYRNQILYSQIKKAKFARFLGSRIELRKGRTMRFGAIPRQDSKNLDVIIAKHMTYEKATTEHIRSPQFICPHCSVVYTSIAKQCRECGATFKSPMNASMLSLCLPGLGDIYLGHLFFGCIELIGSLFLWGYLLMFLLLPDTPIPEREEGIIIFSAVIVVSHVIDALLTQFMATKGLISASEPVHVEKTVYMP